MCFLRLNGVNNYSVMSGYRMVTGTVELMPQRPAKVTLQHLVRPSPYRHQDGGIALASEAKRERAVVHEAEDLEMERHKIGDVVRGPEGRTAASHRALRGRAARPECVARPGAQSL